MPMTAEQLAELECQLHDVLVGNGWAPADADEIIDTASTAAHEGIASMVVAAGAAQEHNRDSAIIIALYIMERLALSEESQIDLRDLPEAASGEIDGQSGDHEDSPRAHLRAC